MRDGDTILDWGCGTGRFAEFLPAGVDYFAWDTAEGMRDRCLEDHPRAVVFDREPSGAFDHVVAVGPFNLPGSVTRTKIEIQRLWELARRSVVVSLYRGADDRCLRYSPRDLFEIVEYAGCESFLVDGSYLANDLMLVMRRSEGVKPW